jgi:23S rRNA pseudouridine1911/1915/1917 synthase
VRLVHHDAQIVVADKPSGISTVAFDPNERGTFDELVRRALGRLSNQRMPPLGIVHRIDKETSGLVIFARTTGAKRHLKQQFRFHTNHRAYLALASGYVQSRKITTRIVADRGDGRRGSTDHAKLGQLATTHVDVVDRYVDATLVRCRLETGRTHQIRIHLAEAGHPLLGERVYGNRSGRSARQVPRLMLHAAELGFVHPTREVRLDFVSELPADFAMVIEQLRLATKV